jgi:hypothetical protein
MVWLLRRRRWNWTDCRPFWVLRLPLVYLVRVAPALSRRVSCHENTYFFHSFQAQHRCLQLGAYRCRPLCHTQASIHVLCRSNSEWKVIKMNVLTFFWDSLSWAHSWPISFERSGSDNSKFQVKVNRKRTWMFWTQHGTTIVVEKHVGSQGPLHLISVDVFHRGFLLFFTLFTLFGLFRLWGFYFGCP